MARAGAPGPNTAELLCEFAAGVASGGAAALEPPGGRREQPRAADRRKRRQAAKLALGVGSLLQAVNPRILVGFSYKVAFLLKAITLSSTAANLIARLIPGAPDNGRIAADAKRDAERVLAAGYRVRPDTDIVGVHDNVGGGGAKPYDTVNSRSSIGTERIENVWCSLSLVHLPSLVGERPLQSRPDLAPCGPKWKKFGPDTVRSDLLELREEPWEDEPKAEAALWEEHKATIRAAAAAQVVQKRAENNGVDPVIAAATAPKARTGLASTSPCVLIHRVLLL